MAEEEKSPAFYERRPFRGVVAVLGLVTAMLAIAGPLRSVIDGLFPGPGTPVLNAEVIFDTSAAMEKPMRGSEKRRDTALEALGDTRFWPAEGVGLRRTDPSCDQEPSDLLVPIGTGHVDEVQAVAARQKPEGSSNLVAAIASAVSEFMEPPYSHDPTGDKRVIVFTAGVDECTADPAGQLESLLRGSGINRARSEFKLIGLKASASEARRLGRIEDVLRRAGAYARVWTPRNNRQANRAVEEINSEAEGRPGVPEPETTIPSGG
jgi:hypothetical protein